MRYGRTRRTGAAVAASVLLAACSGSAVDSGDEGQAVDAADAATDGSATDGDEDEATQGSVTVGLINPLTGPFAALGEDTNDGFQLYLDERGGVLSGYEVTVVSEDTANDTAVAIEGVERLLGRGADVLVGFVNSGVTYGASEVVREAGVPLIITTAGADDLTQRDAAENIFRVSYTSSQDSMPLGEYACQELGYETVAMVGLDYAFGWEAAGGFAMAYEDAGCEIVQELYAPLGTQDWAPFVQQIDRSADAVWTVIAGSDAIRFTRAYSDFGVDLPMLGHGSTTDEQVLEEQQQFAEGAVTTLHYSGVLDTEDNVAFREAFEEEYRSVSQYAEHGYAAAMVIEAALANIDGEVTSEALVDAIAAVEVDAPRGPLAFDEHGQAVYNVYVRETTQDDDGRWVNEVVHTFEDVSQFWTYDPEEFMSGERMADRRGTWTG
ncbi:ABC transporter substrate-binding protein [Nitriliruptor alkaliphilus]|uniref:ABC transporter substrate-binding protein n=1 Tax=Nitriliruptor alkaliphilus TaxID=427918 RepID=UPI0006968005|nr:ABC transporter substrate-binding protein [Nitriliruptor alkaliphilus]